MAVICGRSVVDSLKAGRAVKPELFACASVYFSDIVAFTRLAAQCTPLQVIDLLNNLWTTFDDIIAKYRVYKVYFVYTHRLYGTRRL